MNNMQTSTTTAKPLGDEHSPAFGHGNHTHGGAPGLTKREYIVVCIAQGLVSCPHGDGPSFKSDAHMAKRASEIADALISEMQHSAQEGE